MSKRSLDTITLDEQRELCRLINPDIAEAVIMDIDFEALGKLNIEGFVHASKEEIEWFKSKGFEVPENAGSKA